MVYRFVLTTVLSVLWPANSLSAADLKADELLQRVTAKVAANDHSIHNYTCVETVRREYYRPRASTLSHACSVALELRQHPTVDMALIPASMDRLRVEVTTTPAGEIYSAIGSPRFDDASFKHVVPNGPFGTGMFGAFLGVIFEQDVKQFPYEGETSLDGRRLLQYSFNVAQPDSHYGVKFVDRTGSGMTAYGGSVLVDPETSDPARLVVRTAELPAAAGSCQIIATMDYGRVQIGDKELLLPKRASQRFISADGREVENTVAFSGCREYSSVSRMIYGTEPETTAVGTREATPAVPDRVPEGLRFKMELTAPIDSDTAAAGDRFTGILSEALRAGRQLLAPKGAAVEGHVSMLEVFHEPTEEVFLGLTPESVEIRGVQVPIAALPDSRALMASRRAGDKRMQIFLPPVGEHSATFRTLGLRAVFPKGFSSEWITVAPSVQREGAR